MANNKKPRKPYRKKNEFVDNISHAAKLAGKLDNAERDLMTQQLYQNFDELRAGRASHTTMVHLMDIFNLAEVLAAKFNLLPDHRSKFWAAQEAIVAIVERHLVVDSRTCYATELSAIDTGIEYFEYQLQFVSAGELTRASKIIEGKILGALSGSPGKDHRKIEIGSTTLTTNQPATQHQKETA